MRRAETLRRVIASSLATLAAAIGLAVFATVGSFDGTDPFPRSVPLPPGGRP